MGLGIARGVDRLLFRRSISRVTVFNSGHEPDVAHHS